MSNYKITPDHPAIMHAEYLRNELRREAEMHRRAAQFEQKDSKSLWQRIAGLFSNPVAAENTNLEHAELIQPTSRIDPKLITNQ